jgi:transposase InsO family protein
MAHPRAKLTVAGRRLLVERVLEQGWPPARAAEAQGVSVATAYKWLRRWRAEGLAGLTDRSCRPHTSPRRLPAAREQAILAYRAAHRVGPHRIGWALGEAHSTVHAVLRRHQVPRLWELDRPTGQVVRYQRQRPGELVHLDVKKQGRIPDGGGHRIHGRHRARGGQRKHGLGYDYLHLAVDDCSRVAYLEVHPDDGAATVAGFTQRALAFYTGLGVRVERVLTDNGNGYRAGVFRHLLAGAGVTHKRTRPYRPQSNGKVERLNLTLDREWAYARPIAATSSALTRSLPGCTTTTTIGPTGPSTDGAPCSYSTTSPARTPSRAAAAPGSGPRRAARSRPAGSPTSRGGPPPRRSCPPGTRGCPGRRAPRRW